LICCFSSALFYALEALLFRKAHDIDSLALTHWMNVTNVVLFAIYGNFADW